MRGLQRVPLERTPPSALECAGRAGWHFLRRRLPLPHLRLMRLASDARFGATADGYGRGVVMPRRVHRSRKAYGSQCLRIN